jgi:hypothetical protein
MRGVAVRVGEAVLVGWVWVGKGPSKACIVPAMAVLMVLTLLPLAPRPNTPLLLKMEANPTKTNPRHNRTCIRICKGTRLCFFTLAAFLYDNFAVRAVMG